MAYNFFNLGIIGTEIKRRLDMLRDITGDNKVASTDYVKNEVKILNGSINNLDAELDTQVETLNASITAAQIQLNQNIKQAINLNNGISYLDAGEINELSSDA